MKRSAWVVGSFLLAACSTESIEPVDSYPSLEPTSRLSVPMQPRDEALLPTYAPPESVLDTTGVTPALEVRWPGMHLARGAGYPQTVTLALPQQLHAPCDGGVYEVATTNAFASVEVEGHDVTAELVGELALQLHASSAGSVEITVAGTGVLEAAACGLVAGTAIALTIHQTVTVHPARGRIVARCPLMSGKSPDDEPLASGQPVLMATRVQAGASLAAVLVDEDGATYEAANAQPHAQVAVEIEGDLDAPPEPLTKLSDWFAPARPSAVVLTPAEGTPREVEIVTDERLLSIPLAFNLAGTKVVAVAPLVDDEIYDESVWSPGAQNVIAPVAAGAASTLDGPLCSAPSPEWITVTTKTPGVCTTIPLMPPLAGQPADPLLVAGGPTLGTGAAMLRGGLCELVVSARAVPWSTSFRVTLPDPGE